MLRSRINITYQFRFRISVKKWLYVHIVGQAFVILWTTHCYHLVMAMFIPVAGRSGAAKNPEISIGILGCALTIYISSYLTPLVGLLNKTKWYLLSMLGLFVVTRWGCISLTHVGFPYRDHAGEHPTPQRHMITVSQILLNLQLIFTTLFINSVVILVLLTPLNFILNLLYCSVQNV